MGVDWTNRYIAIEKESSYGSEPGVITAISVATTTIASNYTDGDTTLVLTDASGFANSGTGTIFTSGTGPANAVTFTWTNKSTNTLTVPDLDASYAAGVTVTASGDSNENSGTGTWTAGTSPNDLTGGGWGASGTCTTNSAGGVHSFTITNHGQGYSSAPTITCADIGTISDQPDVSVTLSSNSKGVTYGEADDESMKQTFELLGRSDMSRQVASKAVTSTQYGEGSINLAVQPDDFMGKILYAFLPATEEGDKFISSVSITNAGSGYDNGFVKLGLSGGSPTEAGELIAKVAGGSVTEVYVTNPGKGYGSTPTIAEGDLSSGGNNFTATATMGAARTHIFNEPVLSTHAYPSFTMRVGRGDREHTFTGMVASKLAFSANLNEYVMASVDWIGKNEESTSTLRTDVNFAGLDVDALHFADAEVYFQDNANKTVKVQQISFEININRDLDSAYAVGNRSFTRAPPTQTREITGTMEFNEVIYSDIADYVNEPTYDQLTGSSVHKIQDGGGKPAITLKFKSESGNDYLEFYFYNVRFEAPEASVSGRDPNRMSVGFQAFYDATSNGAGKAIEAKLVGSGSHVQDSAYDS